MLLRRAPAAGRGKLMRILVNVLFYQAIWVLCIFAGNKGAIAGLFYPNHQKREYVKNEQTKRGS